LGEGAPETGLPTLVPIAGFLEFVFGLGPEDNTTRHGSPEQPSPNIGPRHGRIRVRLVLGPASIQLGAKFVRHAQGIISFSVGKALPQRHRELRAILGGQFQKIRQGIGSHGRSSHAARTKAMDRPAGPQRR
jgi:hypothetical protein